MGAMEAHKRFKSCGSRWGRFSKPNRPRTAHSVCARFFASQLKKEEKSRHSNTKLIKWQGWYGCCWQQPQQRFSALR